MLRPALTKLQRSSSERLRTLRALLVIAWAVLLAACANGPVDPIPKAPERWATDGAGLVSQGTLRTLDSRLQGYERQTGHQVVLWIGATSSLSIEDLATRTFQAWGIGRKGQDDGLLILVLATDRKIAIEVGYGLEARVPDAIASRIINDVMVPELRGGNADGAMTRGVEAILAAIDGNAIDGKASSAPAAETPPKSHSKVPKESPPFGAAKSILFGLLALGFLVLLITNPSLALYLLVVLGSGGRGSGGGGFGGGGFSGGGGRSGGGGARGSW